MKTQRFIIALFALTFAFAPQSFRTASAEPKEPPMKGPKYRAELISPRAGQVLVPGQVVRIEWKSVLPNMDLSWCETEIRLSLDGGKSFPLILTPIHLDPNASRILSFEWTVGNTPTAAAVLDIRFGCEQFFPETRSVQSASSFEIGQSAAH